MQTDTIKGLPVLTAYIMTKNEEHCVARCIQALSWCPNIVVADTGSSDKTKDIAKSLGCDVIEVPFDGFGTTRNRILEHIASDWVLCFDADEVCTPELAKEIQETLKNPSASAYLANRLTFLLGKPVLHSGWHPDFRHAVLFKKSEYRYTDRKVHEGFITSGKVEKLKSSFQHYSFPTVKTLMAKEMQYADLGAEAMLAKNKKIGMFRGLGHASWAFCRHFFLRKGFLDGWRGFLIGVSAFHTTFYRYVIAMEKLSQGTKK